jgi:hypothetical protein
MGRTKTGKIFAAKPSPISAKARRRRSATRAASAVTVNAAGQRSNRERASGPRARVPRLTSASGGTRRRVSVFRRATTKATAAEAAMPQMPMRPSKNLE